MIAYKTSGGAQSPQLCSLNIIQSKDYNFDIILNYTQYSLDTNQASIKKITISPGDNIRLENIPIYSTIIAFRKDNKQTIMGINGITGADVFVADGGKNVLIPIKINSKVAILENLS